VRFRLGPTLTALALFPLARARRARTAVFRRRSRSSTVPGSEGKTVFLRATFGVLVSRDAGSDVELDLRAGDGLQRDMGSPRSPRRATGRLWMGAARRALTSTLDGCEVTRAPELTGESVVDLATEPGGERAVVVTSTPGKPAFVWRRPNARAPFARLGAGVLGISFDTVDVAPSKPTRVYATGGAGRWREARAPVPLRRRRRDAGRARRPPRKGRSPLPVGDRSEGIRIASFVRHTNESGTDLLVSQDGGKTFVSALKDEELDVRLRRDRRRSLLFLPARRRDGGHVPLARNIAA